jgi:flavin-dependent dehydrogenase
MNSPRPIEIVGGGLAGLSLGLALRRAGVPAAIFEAGDYPRHRVCGEFITGLDRNTIERLELGPLLADALQHREVAWFIGEKRARLQRLPSPALGLSRHVLDARLAEAFVAAGGELRTRTRFAATDFADGRIFATGRRRGDSPWIGLKFHARRLTPEHDLELHLGDEAYVGLSRVENGRTNVCGLFRRRALCAKGPNLLLGYLDAAGLGALAERLAAADPDPASCSAVVAMSFDGRVSSSPERVTLGDACAMIPPFTGNGMAMAFQSAEIALDPLLAYTRGETAWRETCQRIHTALAKRFRLRLASAHALHPYLLHRPRQRVLGVLTRARLLPLRPLYQLLH